MNAPDRSHAPLAAFPLHEIDTVQSAMHAVVLASLTDVTGAEHAGMTVLNGGVPRSGGTSDDVADRMDAVQHTAGEGPCVETARTGREATRVPDLRTEPRWPKFAAEAEAAGVRSVLSVRMQNSGDWIGALNLYATRPETFTDLSIAQGRALATQGSWAIGVMRRQENLEAALASRDVIGQAKGILMERFKISAGEAFQILIASSQHTHTKLRDLADEIVATGALPHHD